MKFGTTKALSLGTKVTAQPIARVSTASAVAAIAGAMTSTEENTSNVVSVSGLDATLNAPPVSDSEDALSSAT